MTAIETVAAASGVDEGGYVLAVDGGGSKTDVVAVGLDGRVLSRRRGPSSSPQLLGVTRALEVLDVLAGGIVDELAPRRLLQTNVYLAGLDTPEEIHALRHAAAHRTWMTSAAVVDNDMFALLRAGTSSPDAVAVVVGTGINAVGVRADGATERFPAIGEISGDWGGGAVLGGAALWHAARAEDGRGPATSLQQLVPAALGRPDVRSVTLDLHFGRLPRSCVPELSPVLFAAATAGDAVAAGVVLRQGDEVVAMARALLTRLDLVGKPVPVVLGGGVLAAQNPLLMDRIRHGLAAHVPLAAPQVVTELPILGSALLALESAGVRGPTVSEQFHTHEGEEQGE